ncbi:hypothetical protein [Legionella genomosp. 1]|uniref:hypothetical protein n=1 Tax=Legionella genomosp. 1 TaxID=1093625 RepID=UPI0039677BA8
MQIFDTKANVEHFAQSIPFGTIAANHYNLSVSSYVKAKDNSGVIDITKLNAEIKNTVAKINQHVTILMRLWHIRPLHKP